MTMPTGDDALPSPFGPPPGEAVTAYGGAESFGAAFPAMPPGGVPAQYGGTAPLPKRRNVFAVWLGLPIITLGIYSLVWWYKVNRETRFNPRTRVSPFVSLIAVTLGAILIIPVFVSVYRTGQRIADAQRAAGLPSTCIPVVGLVLAFFFSLFTLYYQSEMNKIVDAYPGGVTGQQVPLRGV
jgi:Domain of unknown function (DUF4234)